MASNVNLTEAFPIYQAQQFGHRVGFGERPQVISYLESITDGQRRLAA
jgi:hypothetical protein